MNDIAKKIKLELEIRRSIYSNIVDDMLSNNSYESLSIDQKLELITVVKSHSRLENKYES